MERKKLGFKYLPRPDHYQASLPAGYTALVTNDGSPITEKFIDKLKSNGTSVAVLNLHNIANPISSNAFTLQDNSEDSIANVLKEIRSANGKIGSFVHLHPSFIYAGRNFAQHFDQEREILKTVFLIAKFIKEDLCVLGENNQARFMTVSRMDGFMGKGTTGNVSVVGGGLTGLVKCLNLEWSSVYCRAVDMEPSLEPETMVDNIYNEYYDANKNIVEVAYDQSSRKTPHEITETVKENAPLETSITKDSVFLVSGGAKGVTATCVLALSKAYQCKFILLGRSSIDFEVPAYAQGEIEERSLKAEIMQDLKASGEKVNLAEVKKRYNNIISKKEIESTLEELRSHGSEVSYIKGDVTKVETFKKQVQAIQSQYGKVTGIIHGAGRLADKYIQDKSATDFENVLSVKLDGMLSLFAAVDIHNLDYLVMFSSVAGYYGNVGQSDYAIANEILSKAAHLFKTNHPNTHVSAINWGAWDSGMVSGELKAQFEAMGVKLVNSEGGASMFLNELNNKYDDQASVIIGGTLPAGVSHLGDLVTHKINRTITANENPFLFDHVIQSKAVLPVVNAVGWMAQSCEKLYPDYRVYEVKNTRLFKGLVFDAGDSGTYTLELKEESKSEEEISFSATVTSQGKKLPIIHYKTDVVLRNKQAIPDAPNFDYIPSGKSVLKDGKKLYKNGALFHGPNFQGIEEILEMSDKHMLLSCQAPNVSFEQQGQFQVATINTFFSDIQYQGMVVWVQEQNEGAKSLPLQTDKVILFEPIPFDTLMFVHIEIKESSEYKMVANCTVYDETGKVFMKTQGAAVTVSKQLQWTN